MLINIDIDNTVNDFLDKFIYYLNGIQGGEKVYKKENFTDYNICKDTGLDDEILTTLFFKNNKFNEQLYPIQGSLDVIRMLYDANNDIRFVTSISYDAIQSRLDFVKRYFPYIDPDNQLIITNNKSSIYADIVIDDHMKHIENVNPNCIFILYDSPWNQKDTKADFRVHNWIEVKQVLEELGVL